MRVIRLVIIASVACALNACGKVDQTPAVSGVAVGPGTNTSDPPAGKRIPNYRYTSWEKFKVGTSVTYKSTTELQGKVVSTATTTFTLAGVTDGLITVDTKTVTTGPDGMVIEEASDQFKNNKFVVVDQKSKEDVFGYPAGKLGKGSETLRLLSRDFQTSWYRDRGRVEAGETESKMWVCDEVPSGLLKSNMVVKVANGSTATTELVEIKLP